MKKKKNKLPDFNKMSYKEEANFWDTHSFTEFEDELEDVDIVFDLHKPKEKTLVVRIPEETKNKLTQAARKKGVSASFLARLWLTQRLNSL